MSKKDFAHPRGRPFFSPFSLLFSVLCLLFCLCTFSCIFLLAVFPFSFLILSHDFHEALFLTIRTYLSRVQYIQNVLLKYGMEKKKKQNTQASRNTLLTHYVPYLFLARLFFFQVGCSVSFVHHLFRPLSLLLTLCPCSYVVISTYRKRISIHSEDSLALLILQ